MPIMTANAVLIIAVVVLFSAVLLCCFGDKIREILKRRHLVQTQNLTVTLNLTICCSRPCDIVTEEFVCMCVQVRMYVRMYVRMHVCASTYMCA